MKISNETSMKLLENAKIIIEAVCDNEELEEVKDSLKDAVEKLDDVIDGDKKDDKKVDEKTKEVVNETISALYQKAALTESVDCAEACIAKAEELQKAIDDIPEETPAKDDEYPADDVTGGEGDTPGLDDEIKDLVGDNSEALKLLNTNNNSVTIEA